ncbi:thioredoxin [Mycoplasma sp. E35C]|uniref:thioredoxin n=1 Tax=Mycoplasma sp. E35C TaxID=2801918 RepID=UPI001CA3F310|nr:thioredoxin [Mycoplasma sp. E35C]QZX49072.1 thioredoxin [Mycoplasma sp. E35C]
MKHVTSKAEFEQLIKDNKKVVVDFYADWCGPCKMFGPVFEQVSKEKTDWTFIKVNVDEAEELSIKYQVASIPTLYTFKNGEIENKKIGFIPKEVLLTLLD